RRLQHRSLPPVLAPRLDLIRRQPFRELRRINPLLQFPNAAMKHRASQKQPETPLRAAHQFFTSISAASLPIRLTRNAASNTRSNARDDFAPSVATSSGVNSGLPSSSRQ